MTDHKSETSSEIGHKEDKESDDFEEDELQKIKSFMKEENERRIDSTDSKSEMKKARLICLMGYL